MKIMKTGGSRVSGSVLGLAFSLTTLTGCFDTGIDHSKNAPNARTLSEARQAVADRSAKAARSYYQNAWRADPTQVEAAYVLAGIDLQTQVPEPLRKLPEVHSGKVLRWLAQAQFHLRPTFQTLQRIQRYYFNRSLRLDFEPIDLNPGSAFHRVMDAGSVTTLLMGLDLSRGWLQLFQMLQMKGIEKLDQKLEAARRAIWTQPRCADPTQKLACGQAAMDSALEIFHDTEDRDHGTALTLTENGGRIAALNGAQMVKVMKLFVATMQSRAKLDTKAEYLVRTPKRDTLQLLTCLTGPCRTPWGIRADVPGFLRKLAAGRDLRVLVPTRVMVTEPGSRSPEDFVRFLKGVAFKDPTLGGLFPDGDLVRTALKDPESDIGRFVWAYCHLFTDWVFEAVPR